MPDEVFWREFFRRFPQAHRYADTEPVRYREVPEPRSKHDLLGHARWALRDGKWTPIDTWVERVRAQGFEHKWEPVHGERQLGWSLRSYANHKHATYFEVQGRGRHMKIRLRPATSGSGASAAA